MCDIIIYRLIFNNRISLTLIFSNHNTTNALILVILYFQCKLLLFI